MAKQDIGIGAAPNDGTGDSLRAAGQKINENFTEVYDAMVPAGGTTGQALVKVSDDDHDMAWDDVAAGGGGGEMPKYIHVVDEKASGTNGGIPVVGWQTRTLNTVKANTLTGANLAANEVTLPAGTYFVQASAPGYYVNRHRLRLRNVTAGTTLLLGDAAISPNDVSNMAATHSLLTGYFTVATPTVVRLEHYFQSTSGNPGFGLGTGTGEAETYASLVIQKVAASAVVGASAEGGPVELIANVVLGADGTFPVIDTTGFRSVKIVYNLKKSGADADFFGSSFRFNGVAANYYSKNLYTSGGGGAAADAQVVNGASGSMALIPSVSAGAPRLAAGGVIEFTGLDSALTKGWIDRNVSYRVSDGGVFQHQVNGFWDNAAVVTSIALLTSFKAGSSIQVTGIRSDAAPSVPNRGFDVRASAEVTEATPPTFIGFGIASVVKLATAIYQVNFSSPMPNTDYVVFGSAKFPGAAANISPVFGLCRNTNLLGGAIGKQLNYVVIDLYSTDGGAYAIDSFDIMVGYPVAYTGTSRDGLLGRAYKHNVVVGVNTAAREDIPDMTVTFTMPVDGEIELDFDIILGRAGGTIRLFIMLDGVDIVNAQPGEVAYNAIGMSEHANLTLKGKQIYAMTAGVHTIKLQASAVGSTVSASYKDRSMVVRRLA